MQRTTTQPTEVVSELICDRCGGHHLSGAVEFAEFLRIDTVGGYGSVFGDGTRVQLDLCPACTHSALGAWMRRQDEPSWSDQVNGLLRMFDPERHGGEWPAGEGKSLFEPK
jgi:hypothetical protein